MNRFLGTLLACALLLAGCAPSNDPRLGGHNRPKMVKTVISLSPSTSELLGVNEQFQEFAGKTRACNWPVSIRNVQVVADVKPDYEKIAGIRPDLILVDTQLYSAADMAKIKQIGGEVFEWDPKTIEDYKKRIMDLTNLMGGENNTSTYLDKLDDAIQAAKARAPQKKWTVAIVLPDKSGQHMWMGTDSFQGEEVRAAQLDLIGPKGDRFAPLDAEALIKADPDYLLLATQSPGDFIGDPRFAQLKAVKSGKAFGLNPDLILRRGGRVDMLIEGLSKKIYGAH